MVYVLLISSACLYSCFHFLVKLYRVFIFCYSMFPFDRSKVPSFSLPSLGIHPVFQRGHSLVVWCCLDCHPSGFPRFLPLVASRAWPPWSRAEGPYILTRYLRTACTPSGALAPHNPTSLASLLDQSWLRACLQPSLWPVF